MKNDHPTVWPLKCPQCGDRIKIELPVDTEEGRRAPPSAAAVTSCFSGTTA